LQSPLNGDRALDSFVGALKCHEELVSDGFHDFPVVGCEL